MDARSERLTPEELLTHAAWIRALARSLVRDEATAEDLAQGTCLAALRHPPRTDRPVRPWLRRVLRNFLLQRHREDRRRERREAGAARPEAALPTPDELAAHLEMQRRVSRLVAGLREPLRSTVLLRYAEDLTAAEIARRKGVPAGTVRWRLKTALDEIRSRLDEEHDGDRRRWVLGLLPMIGALPASARAAPAAGAATAALKTLLAVAVGTVLLMALVTQLGTSVSRDPLAPPPDPDPAAYAPASGEPGAEGAPAGAALPGARGERAKARMRFLDGDGRPIPGVEIRYRAENSRVARGTSDAEGIVEFTGDYMSPDRFRAVAPGRATRFFEVKLRRGEATDLGEFVLDRGCVVAGRVTDQEGAPIPKARVLVTEGAIPPARIRLGPTEGPIGRFDFVAVADAHGEYRLEGSPGGELPALGLDPGYLWSVSEPVRPDPDAPVHTDLRLVRDADADCIEGRILDPTGAPAAGVEIAYTVSAPGFGCDHTGMTGREGRFRILLPWPMRLDLRIRDPKERWTGLDLEDVPSNGPPLELKLDAARSLRLIVKDTEGEPLENLVHQVEFPHSTVPDEVEVTSRHPEGVLVVRIPPRRFAVRVSAPFHEERVMGPFEPASTPEEQAVVLAPRPGIRGRVRADGRPVAGARVFILRPVRPDQVLRKDGFRVKCMEEYSSRTSTDSRGRFHADLRTAGEVLVRVQADGFAPTELGPFPFDPARGLADLEASLGPGGALEGRLLPPDGESPAGAIIGISRADTFPRSVRVGPDGRYRFDLLTPGRYVVRRLAKDVRRGGGGTSGARRKAPPPIPFTCVVEEGETTILDLDERGGPLCELVGSLRIDGASPDAWTVVLVDEDPRRDPTLGHPETETGPNGDFRFGLSRTGPRRLTLFRKDRAAGLVGRIRLERGVDAWRCEFETGTISGEVESFPLGRGEFLVHRRQVRDGVFCLTRIAPDSEGRFRGLRVPAGEGQIIRVRCGLCEPAALNADAVAEVLVPQGGEVRVNLP